jgi:hypothetical protein
VAAPSLFARNEEEINSFLRASKNIRLFEISIEI